MIRNKKFFLTKEPITKIRNKKKIRIKVELSINKKTILNF
jgi:hypothetical protein